MPARTRRAACGASKDRTCHRGYMGPRGRGSENAVDLRTSAPYIRPMRTLVAFALLVTVTAAAARTAVPVLGRDWPQFRGIHARGVADTAGTPMTWNVPEQRGVAWKTPVPGLGHSSPVIWGNTICVTTAISGKPDPELKVGLYGDIQPVQDDTVHTWKVLCFDKGNGTLRWEKTAAQGVPKVKRHTKS